MEATELIKKQIRQAIPGSFRNLTELAEKAEVSQPNLSGFMKGKRKSMNLETAWKIWNALKIHQRPDAPGAPADTKEIEAKSLTVLGVHAAAGAGDAKDDEDHEPKFHIAVPSQYVRPQISTLLIEGVSMEPTILDKAVVGVNRESEEIVQGRIYAVRLPYEGIVVKRLFLNHAAKCFILRSDNKNGDFPDINLPFEEGNAFIYGQVIWVLQSYEKIVF
ncbi:MAG: hypothetical protein LBO64_03320 [Desulfovibrio sp.]|jgi:phage repressor protein C with HTH and peptisase S24 domain|nr:hypothetical protein [Desulfovibrio sp.]